MRGIRGALCFGAMLAGACAPTTSTGTLPVEVLVVLDSAAPNLLVVSVDSTDARATIDLATLPFVPSLLATRGGLAAVAGVASATQAGGVAIIDLANRSLVELFTLPLGNVSAITFADERTIYVGSGTSHTAQMLELQQHAQQPIPAPSGAQGFVLARGKVFAVIGNRIGCAPIGCNNGPSWLVRIDPSVPRDSIPLSGPGNAGPAALGPDGYLYVLSAGEVVTEEGRLSIADPVRNLEIATFAGVGPIENAWIASDGGSRILIATPVGGLLVFDSRERRFTFPFGNGIPLTAPTDLVTDAVGAAYVSEQRGCAAVDPGLVRVFSGTLVERPSLRLGTCPVALGIAEIPADRIFPTAP